MNDHHILLHEPPLSLKHEKLAQLLATEQNILIVQDLDGVCMGLVKDPLTRVISLDYVKATGAFDGHFYVLTNGEHIGKRGVNKIIEKAAGDEAIVKAEGWYLPGLAAGGVQWQDRYGRVSHPGVSDAELAFLETVPKRIETAIRQVFDRYPNALDSNTLEICIQSAVLDNKASPTANLNAFYERLSDRIDIYAALQKRLQTLVEELISEANAQGLNDSFFVHYAPNLGRNDRGLEILRPAKEGDSGTTDFQFMLRGAIKEAGVLALLNRYYFHRTGTYPLGEDFSVRQAPKTHSELLQLVADNFDAEIMPIIIGVGDTVNSTAQLEGDRLVVRRGGSDRNFLQLIQDIDKTFNKGNIVVYIDSSDGEVKNRKPLKLGTDPETQTTIVLEGPGDPKDTEDPLILNVVFPGGYQDYTTVFQAAAKERL